MNLRSVDPPNASRLDSIILFEGYPTKVLNTPLVSLCITTHSTHFNPLELIGLYKAKSTHHDTPRKEYFSFPRSEVITVVLITIHVFWNVTLPRPEKSS